jgi:RIO-like serine/threonine protein kinase
MLEYIKGKPLASIIHDALTKSPSDADEETTLYFIRLVQEIYSSLDKLHIVDVAHRFIQPRKCLVKENQHIIWIDFTQSCHFDDDIVEKERQLLKYQDLGNVNNIFERLFQDLKIDYVYDESTSIVIYC